MKEVDAMDQRVFWAGIKYRGHCIEVMANKLWKYYPQVAVASETGCKMLWSTNFHQVYAP